MRPRNGFKNRDEVVELRPDDEGLGNIRPDEVVELLPDDKGLGNIRPALRNVPRVF
jgi:hypothetical protein